MKNKKKTKSLKKTMGLRQKLFKTSVSRLGRKQLEEEIKLFNDLINQSNDAIIVVNPETSRFLYVNDKVCSNLGYSRGELLNMKVVDIEAILPDSFSWNKHVEEVKSKGCMILEGEHKRKDGTTFPVEVNVRYISLQERQYMVAVARDITERKMMEEKIRSKADYLDKLHNALGDAVFSVKMPERVIHFANNSVKSIFGYEPQECIGLAIEIFYPDKESFLNFGKELQTAIFEEKDILCTEGLLKRKNGDTFPAHIITTFLHENGQVTDIISIVRDITELKKIEEKKVTNQKRFAQEIAESLPGTFCIFDEHGHIESWNKNFETATGYSAEEISKTHPIDFFVEGDREHMTAIMKDVLSQGKAEAEAEVLSKDGRRTPYLLIGRKVSIDDNLYIFGLGLDITERKKVEQELFKMQKLESLGILAGGIAHDFNNVLTGILGNVSLAKMRAGSEEKTMKALTEAEKACYRARELTRQLITFSKGGVPIKETISVSELIKDITIFTLSGSKARPEFYITDDLWPVEADKGQISQVISNLILNADQAMLKGGVIEVRCKNITLSENNNLLLENGRYVKIMIKDQGCGIAQEHLGKVFDPYFTTKQKGSGLGLSTVYSIVKKHYGHISVGSELGKGTTFVVYLPASEKEVTKTQGAEAVYVLGKGRVLMVDDEEMIRDLAGKILVKLGYEVDCAKDGAKAIELYRRAQETGRSFDVVIMDLTIPGGMGGKEAIQKLLEIDPSVKAIVSSGYSDDAVIADYRAYGFSAFILKPYTIASMSKVISDVIQGIVE